MHSGDRLDLRYLRDMPQPQQADIVAGLLASEYARRSERDAEWLRTDLTIPDIETLYLDQLEPADLREWARILRGTRWDDAAAHLDGLANGIDQYGCV